MNKCPITYKECREKYSIEGLSLLSRNLNNLNDIEYSADEQRHQAAIRSTRMSIQGVQPKLSVRFDIRNSKFEIVDLKGTYILKPQHHIYPQLPENEDLTMKMACICGINTPVHGLVYSKDGSLTYFIKRFDRIGKSKKIAVEDFAQLAQMKRETKYNYSIEKLINLIDTYCTFPAIEKTRLFKRILFNFLIGNEDMHLKNYSVINNNGKIELSPAYDFLNTTIILSGDIEESALTIKGKKKNLNSNILIDYLGKERLNLTNKVIQNIVNDIQNSIPEWLGLIDNSFLANNKKEAYAELLNERIKRLGWK